MGKKKKNDNATQNMVLGALVVGLIAIGAYIFVLRDNDAGAGQPDMAVAEAAPAVATAPAPSAAQPAANSASAQAAAPAAPTPGVNEEGGPTESIVAMYVAEIADTDTYNSGGDKLTTVAEIVRQDRANFYKGLGQSADENDSFFSSPDQRAKIADMLARGSVVPATRQAILNGNAQIQVVVQERNGVMTMTIS